MLLEDDDELLESLERKREEVERYLSRLNTAIAALRGSSGELKATTASGVIPPIVDIAKYLSEHEGPVHQNDIIRAVGDLRRKRYPSLTTHYSSVWRALEYHVRHDRLISCVNQQGRSTKLKPLPRRSKGKKLSNSPELYLQDNWFVLKNEEGEEDYAVGSSRNSNLFGQD